MATLREYLHSTLGTPEERLESMPDEERAEFEAEAMARFRTVISDVA